LRRARRWLPLAALLLSCARPPAPSADVTGTLVFVSDRSGMDALYMRKLPGELDLRLTYLGEPVKEPALAPDSQQAAFVVGGRVALVTLATRDLRYLSLGREARDSAPAFFPDGQRLVIASRKSEGDNAELYELTLGDGVESPRRRLTETPADESEPVVSPDGRSIVFVREDNLQRLELADGRVRKLTGGFRKTRQPRFLASGRILCLWSEGKRYGIDVLDGDGRNRTTLQEGSAFHRTVAPSPDGRHLVATYTFDLGFRPTEMLTRRRNEELRLLDARGRLLRALSEGWRSSSHSATWGR
jgi:Tol biopolymer transport system component